MPFDPNASELTIGVVGTGSMGRGIMQVSAQGGMRVIAYDEKPGAAQAARNYIAKMLAGQVEKGRLPAAEADAAVARVVVAKDLAEVGKANLIIEAIIDRQGRVQSPRVLKGQPYGLSEAAIAAVKQWSFKPATINGRPVRVFYVLSVNFRVDLNRQPFRP